MSITDLLKRALNDTIVYWATPVPDGDGGYTFTSPVELLGYWDEKMKLFLTPNGIEELSTAVIYLKQDVTEGGYLYLGSLSDLDSDNLPDTQTGAYEILAWEKSPDIKGRTYLRKVFVQ